MIINFPNWTDIEAQINILEKTGNWPFSKVPEWAEQTAKKLHCSSGNTCVIENGLREIIRQLKEDLEMQVAIRKATGEGA